MESYEREWEDYFDAVIRVIEAKIDSCNYERNQDKIVSIIEDGYCYNISIETTSFRVLQMFSN